MTVDRKAREAAYRAVENGRTDRAIASMQDAAAMVRHIIDVALDAYLEALSATEAQAEVVGPSIEGIREKLRLLMLAQPTTGLRETYSDGFAMGLCTAIECLDGTVSPHTGNGGVDEAADELWGRLLPLMQVHTTGPQSAYDDKVAALALIRAALVRP